MGHLDLPQSLAELNALACGAHDGFLDSRSGEVGFASLVDGFHHHPLLKRNLGRRGLVSAFVRAFRLPAFGSDWLAYLAENKLQHGTRDGDEGRKAVRIVLLGLALGWWVYQASVVLRHIAAVPKIRQQVETFTAELEQLLPKNSVLLVGSFSPDPTLALLENRPDLQLYQLMPSRMLNKRAMKQLREKLTHMLVLEKATKKPFFRGREIGRWHIDFGGLTKSPHQGVTIVLLEVGSQKAKAR